MTGGGGSVSIACAPASSSCIEASFPSSCFSSCGRISSYTAAAAASLSSSSIATSAASVAGTGAASASAGGVASEGATVVSIVDIVAGSMGGDDV